MGRPETLVQAVAWLDGHKHESKIEFQRFSDGSRGVDVTAFDGSVYAWERVIVTGTISAAIIEAVGHVWSQIHESTSEESDDV